MSKPTFISIIVSLVIMLGAVVLWWRREPDYTAWPSRRDQLLARAVMIPAGVYDVGSREPGCYPRARIDLPGFYIWPVEVPRTWWARYKGLKEDEGTRHPAATLSWDDAEAFCRWMSGEFGLTVRLPSVDEWQVAARAGTSGVIYPWGWASPVGRAVYGSDAASEVGRFDANPWGLYDMAGNVAEWCQAEEGSETAPVMGGSWAERSDKVLRISHRLLLPKTYRDADTGFRIVVEVE